MANIVAYLSHSYHPEDRAINMAIWRKLNAFKVAFAVDPPSNDRSRPMDVTFLERMMQRSHCFVAIVPDRSRALGSSPSSPTWSPYQEFECRLAIRANKPRLIVVEKGVELGPLSEGQTTRWFKRSPFELDPDLENEIQRFVAAAAAATREREQAFTPKMGILRWMPADDRWNRLCAALFRRVGKEVTKIIEVNDETRDHDLLNEARNHNLIVADINPRITPPHVLGLLHGATVPIFRTCLLDPDDREDEHERALRLKVDELDAAAADVSTGVPAASVRLPLLFRGYRIDLGMRPIQFWRTSEIEQTVGTIARITTDYRDRERKLETKENGDDYFLKLRGNRVFISTSSELSAWTTPLKAALDDAGMPAFHYKESDIPSGVPWMPALRERIANADLFLAFLSPDFWASSVCMEEMALAIERWERHQLIIIVATRSARPPMPGFLGRYQGEALSDSTRNIEAIVSHVQDRFRRVGRNDAMSVESIARPLARHLEAEGNLSALLERECHLPAGEAADFAERAGASATTLVEMLVNRARVDKVGATALGRLCFWVRSREADHETQSALTRQFSLLRLFPKLHDVRAWNERRSRKDVEITVPATAPRQALEVVSALAGERIEALDAVKRIGPEMARYLDVSDREALTANERCRVSVVSSVDDLMIPVEWAVFPGMSSPLARSVPVVRRIAHSGPRRESIEDLFEGDAAAPPRVLLFGYGPPQLPHVRAELAAIQDQFTRRYAENEWPTDLIKTIIGDGATADVLRLNVSTSDVDIVHIAGHAGWLDDGPVLQVAGSTPFVPSRDLGQWLQGSSARFVYLSCCGGASTPLAKPQFAGWRRSLCRDVIEAGVAEIAGYFWPVSDERSARFAAHFYERFLRDFDAPGAMLAARLSTTADDPVWAGSVIVKTTRPQSRS